MRRAGLPRPGTDRQLQDFVARVQPRKLDRTRPLWEVYYVEGSRADVAIVTKTHHAIIDGVHALDIAHVIVDSVRGEGLGEDQVPWEPKAPPSSAELVAGAFVDAVRRPTQVVDQVRGGLDRRPQRRPPSHRVGRDCRVGGRADGRPTCAGVSAERRGGRRAGG